MARTRVTEADLKQGLLRALADAQSLRILNALVRAPLSATQLIHQERLPSSSTYRHLRDLLSHGIIVIDRTVIRPDGKVFQTYRSAFADVKVSMHAGEVFVDAEPTVESMDRAFRLFHSFDKE
ncbi:MAG TPA: winged helix-turn-helix domain-containing protein [Thermoplasmata archaeon]|nr:winged helix-turn-helix domain-containing protein [Thermoplasmata archaeon]